MKLAPLKIANTVDVSHLVDAFLAIDFFAPCDGEERPPFPFALAIRVSRRFTTRLSSDFQSRSVSSALGKISSSSSLGVMVHQFTENGELRLESLVSGLEFL